MLDAMAEALWLRWTRQIVAFGLLIYLASFFFLAPSQQKTFFYLLVAAPGLALFCDFRLLLRYYKIPVSCVLAFLVYFCFSSLWSVDGQLVDGLKLALCIASLMLAVHSTMSVRNNSGAEMRYFILAVGYCAAFFYVFIVIFEMLDAAGYSAMLSGRLSLSILSGWGDGNPINTAIYFGLVVLVAWWEFPNGCLLNKVGLLFLIIVSSVIIVFTQSRGPFLALALTLVLMSALRRSRDDLFLWGGVLLAGVAAIANFNLLQLILERSAAPNYRVEIWLYAIELIKTNLIFGQGLGDAANIPISLGGGGGGGDVVIFSHAHSSIIDTLRVGGLVGWGLFLVMVLTIACRCFRISGGGCFYIFWLGYGLLCLSTNGRLPFMRPSVEWFAFWMPLFFCLFQPDRASSWNVEKLS